MPDGAVEVEREGAVVTTTACEAPGITAPTLEQFDRVFYTVLGQRIYAILEFAREGDLSLRSARCAADFVITDPAVIELFETAFTENRDLTEQEFGLIDRTNARASQECRIARS
jgi:hypothetical protein